MLSPIGRARAAAGIPRGTTDGRSHIEDVPDELAIEIDSDGSPVSFPAADWFVCFVPGLQKQWWHRFTNAKYQHVFAIRMVDDSCWILVEPWWDENAGVATRNADRALAAVEADGGKSLRADLLHVGNGIMTALMSRSGLGLYKVAVSESSRFGVVANAYWKYAPQRAIETVRKVLQQAQLRGEINIEDPSVAAGQFFAMLRGDIHLEILFGLRSRPDAAEIHVRVTSAVDLILNGTLATDLSAPKHTPGRRCTDAFQSIIS